MVMTRDNGVMIGEQKLFLDAGGPIRPLVTYSLQHKLIPARPQLDQVFVDIDP
jgi:hypothetical protein